VLYALALLFIAMTQLYTTENIGEIVKKVQNGGHIPEYKKYYFEKLKTALQVHTRGKLFDKVITVFNNEDPESSKFVLETYESVTKGSIWRGIDNISRIYNNTGFDVTGDKNSIDKLSESNFFTEYIEEFTNKTLSTDPNSLQVWMKKLDGTYECEFIETQFIQLLSEDEIGFVDIENSEYEISVESSPIGSVVNQFGNQYKQGKKVTKSYYEGTKITLGSKVRYIYINKFQYVEIDYNGKEANVTITNFPNPLRCPYSFTGVDELEHEIYNSAVANFIPFGNHALIQHRTYRSVEALFGYPRMSEVELPCEQCVRGQETCEPCEDYPDGLKTCSNCHGTGHVSLQSPFKIYKRKLFPDSPELNANIKPVEFFTPDIAILQYNAEAWQNTLKMGEEAIYIQQKQQTGNVESAKAREIQLEAMYSWLSRISNTIYNNIQKSINNFCNINGLGYVSVNKPISFAILNELDAFDYLNTIVNTDAPVFIKTTHIENFLNKYISKTSVVIKVVEILKRVDPFVFYTMKDLQTLSDSGVINDRDWKVHAYAYPLLMMLFTRYPEAMDYTPEQIETMLLGEIDKKVVREIPQVDPNFKEVEDSIDSSINE
jgi:hypothetical protein